MKISSFACVHRIALAFSCAMLSFSSHKIHALSVVDSDDEKVSVSQQNLLSAPLANYTTTILLGKHDDFNNTLNEIDNATRPSSNLTKRMRREGCKDTLTRLDAMGCVGHTVNINEFITSGKIIDIQIDAHIQIPSTSNVDAWIAIDANETANAKFTKAEIYANSLKITPNNTYQGSIRCDANHCKNAKNLIAEINRTKQINIAFGTRVNVDEIVIRLYLESNVKPQKDITCPSCKTWKFMMNIEDSKPVFSYTEYKYIEKTNKVKDNTKPTAATYEVLTSAPGTLIDTVQSRQTVNCTKSGNVELTSQGIRLKGGSLSCQLPSQRKVTNYQAAYISTSATLFAITQDDVNLIKLSSRVNGREFVPLSLKATRNKTSGYDLKTTVAYSSPNVSVTLPTKKSLSFKSPMEYLIDYGGIHPTANKQCKSASDACEQFYVSYKQPDTGLKDNYIRERKDLPNAIFIASDSTIVIGGSGVDGEIRSLMIDPCGFGN